MRCSLCDAISPHLVVSSFFFFHFVLHKITWCPTCLMRDSQAVCIQLFRLAQSRMWRLHYCIPRNGNVFVFASENVTSIWPCHFERKRISFDACNRMSTGTGMCDATTFDRWRMSFCLRLVTLVGWKSRNAHTNPVWNDSTVQSCRKWMSFDWEIWIRIDLLMTHRTRQIKQSSIFRPIKKAIAVYRHHQMCANSCAACSSPSRCASASGFFAQRNFF